MTDEQEAFICRVIEISFDKRKCRDLITLDMLHAYCGGPELTPIARKLNIILVDVSSYILVLSFCLLHTYACLHNVCLLPFAEMEATKQRALVKASATACINRRKRGPPHQLLRASPKGRPSERVRGRMTIHLRKDRPSLQVTNQRSCRLPNLAIELARV